MERQRSRHKRSRHKRISLGQTQCLILEGPRNEFFAVRSLDVEEDEEDLSGIVGSGGGGGTLPAPLSPSNSTTVSAHSLLNTGLIPSLHTPVTTTTNVVAPSAATSNTTIAAAPTNPELSFLGLLGRFCLAFLGSFGSKMDPSSLLFATSVITALCTVVFCYLAVSSC